ncbi:helix-turn-helix transcriptional regulator [Tropicibacter oceani]|uniref:Transcriptional regulator n=1 Tax=Tropicibacter oceani TaxID=3058420 RepID=A0ABY8QIR6_9RHOB|nr:transcriptional regulator [Tropicibacter oceani]WGW04535.1 transcriptional regulator [Tropicibacter oceani]
MATKYITFTELRALLGNRSRSAVYNDIDAGRLPKPLKLGGRNYWPLDETEEHLRAQRDGGA